MMMMMMMRPMRGQVNTITPIGNHLYCVIYTQEFLRCFEVCASAASNIDSNWPQSSLTINWNSHQEWSTHSATAMASLYHVVGVVVARRSRRVRRKWLIHRNIYSTNRIYLSRHMDFGVFYHRNKTNREIVETKYTNEYTPGQKWKEINNIHHTFTQTQNTFRNVSKPTILLKWNGNWTTINWRKTSRATRPTLMVGSAWEIHAYSCA